MHARTPVLAAALVVLCASFVFCPLTAVAQVTEPDVTGHGGCQQAPTSEPAPELNAISFDTFLLDRTSRFILAATRWQPTTSSCTAPLSQARPIMIRARAVR